MSFGNSACTAGSAPYFIAKCKTGNYSFYIDKQLFCNAKFQKIISLKFTKSKLSKKGYLNCSWFKAIFDYFRSGKSKGFSNNIGGARGVLPQKTETCVFV